MEKSRDRFKPPKFAKSGDTCLSLLGLYLSHSFLEQSATYGKMYVHILHPHIA